ncbi:hypothetical protein A6R68_05408 [Neotoma lepida]|uniref:Carboxypeptidase n=1 Tax=Neotoma lepida TaxID=56216 RepID=A0A1A6GL42_NEOLE|nr:hypothetical protein A6R68_05408 [Neotoma lepida]
MLKVTVSLVLFMVSPGDGLFRSIYRTTFVSRPFGGNAGWPLFLSPYLKAGKIEEAQKKSQVSPFPGMSLESYAGYITVNKTYNSNLFFWFFPARIKPKDAPVVLWLQGGPGGSSMFGLFVEHGPYVITSNMTVRARDFPWTTTLSMLYIDNPVGTGFSFTDNLQGYAISEIDVAQNLYRMQYYLLRTKTMHQRNAQPSASFFQTEGMLPAGEAQQPATLSHFSTQSRCPLFHSALVQFFKLFPEYAKNEFYITGEVS